MILPALGQGTSGALLAAGRTFSSAQILENLSQRCGRSFYVEEGRLHAFPTAADRQIDRFLESHYSDRHLKRLKSSLRSGELEGQRFGSSRYEAVRLTDAELSPVGLEIAVSRQDFRRALRTSGLGLPQEGIEFFLYTARPSLSANSVSPLWLVPPVMSDTSPWWEWREQALLSADGLFALTVHTEDGQLRTSWDAVRNYGPRLMMRAPDGRDALLLTTVLAMDWGIELNGSIPV